MFAFTGAAFAGTVSVVPGPDGSEVTFTDGSGADSIESNAVKFSVGTNSRVLVSDINDIVLAQGAPCTRSSPKVVLCTPAQASGVVANLGPGDDSVQNQTSNPAVNGEFHGGDGNDSLVGGGADDLLDGGPGADDLNGGGGTDTADYSDRTAGVFVSLNGVGDDGEGCPNLGTCEGDNAGPDVENINGGGGDDILIGSNQQNVLVGNAGNDDLSGAGNADHLEGDAGTDTADYSDHSADITASLDAGTESSGEDGNGGDTYESDIEAIVGGSGNDTLVGSDNGDDTIDGGPGDDTMIGGPTGGGADTFFGSSGQDTVDYGPSGEDRGGNDDLTVTADGKPDDGSSGEGDDVEPDVEVIQGGGGDDSFTGSDVDNTLKGGTGNDTLDGGGGSDTVDGEAGTDTASYASHTEDVKITLGNNVGAENGAPGEGDTILNTEDARGGAGNDTLVGDANPNSLAGGGGTDTVDYSNRTAQLSVTIDGVADDGESGEGDNVQTDVENIIGGSDNDQLSGFGDFPNRLDGGPGDDTLNGGAGDDDLHGGPGTDTLNGQAGNDNLDGGAGGDILNGSTGSDTADYSARNANVSVTFDGVADDGESGEGDNVQVDVENATGGSGNDTLTGNDVANVLTGGDGSDTLSGGGGPDLIRSRDAFVDNVTCGDDADTVEADKLDNIASDCETIEFPPVPQPSGENPPGQNPPGQKPPTTNPITRVLPRSLSVKVNPKRDRRRPYRFVITGVVNPPTSLTRQTACADGRISAQFKVGSRTISTRRASIDFRCRFRMTVTFANRRRLGRGRLKVVVRFLGNTRMRPLAAKSQNLRAG